MCPPCLPGPLLFRVSMLKDPRSGPGRGNRDLFQLQRLSRLGKDGREHRPGHRGAMLCRTTPRAASSQKLGFAAMTITIEVSNAVSKRKMAKSRRTRRPTSSDSGPNS